MKFELNFLPTNATDDDIFNEVRRVDSIINKKHLTRTDFDKNSKVSSSHLVRRFNSWQEVLEKSGLGHKYSGRSVSEKMLNQKAKFLSDEEIISELQRIAKILNKNTITTDDIKHNSSIIGPRIVKSRFGSWSAGIKKANLSLSRFGQRYSDEEYFENLLNVWAHYGRQPLLREMNSSPSEITAGAYEQKFGGWRKALEAFVMRMNQDEIELQTILKKTRW